MVREYLRSFPLFADLAEADLTKVGELVRQRKYREAMYVFAEGDPVEAVYFIQSGMVKASRMDDEGHEQIVNLLVPGDFFPHVGFLDGGPAPATTVTVGETILGLLNRRDFMALLGEHPSITARLLAAMDKRLRGLQDQVKELGLLTAPSRVGRILLRLAQQIGEDRGELKVLHLGLSQQDVASMAGVSRETVSRLLSEFRREGIVSGEANQLVIDVKRLTKMV